MASGHQVNFPGPARGKRYVSDKMLALRDNALGALLKFHKISKEGGAHPRNRIQETVGSRAHKRVGINLSVRVVQGYPNLHTPVLKNKNLFNTG